MAVVETDEDRTTALSINYMARPGIADELSRATARTLRTRLIHGVIGFAVSASVITELQEAA